MLSVSIQYFAKKLEEIKQKEMKKKSHPYELRLRIREKLPWFLIDLGFAAKGKNCETVGAKHRWYNKSNNLSACYYCKIIKEGKLWEKGVE